MAKDHNHEPEAVDNLITIGTEIAGGVTGAAIGLFAAGPVGALAGGAAAPLVTHTFRKVAGEIKQRLLGHREEVRIGAAFTFAAAKVQQNIAHGKQLRQDEFFQDDIDDRSTAEEIAEGTLLAAQREHEERKLRFYGNLMANIAFHPEITRPHANQMLRQVERMSYRQLCFLALFVRLDELKFARVPRMYQEYPAFDEASIVQEIYDLFQQGLFHRPDSFAPDVYIRSANLRIDASQWGLKLYELMELYEIDAEELKKLLTQLDGECKRSGG